MEKYSGIIALVILLVVLVIFIKYQANHGEEEEVEEVKHHEVTTSRNPLDVNDEDAVVASLIASIELRNETHKNVEVISVRRVG